MKRLLLASLSLFAPFALALSVPWDSLDGTEAQTVSPRQEIALNGATEWVLRVALPTSPKEYTGHLLFRDANGNTLEKGWFAWIPSATHAKSELKLKQKVDGLTQSYNITVQNPSLEWEWNTDYFKIFLVSDKGRGELYTLSRADLSAAYDHLSLEVSDPDAFGFAQFVVVTPGPSDPNAPEPGAFSFILLGGGVLLVLRRPSQWRANR